MGFTVDIDTGGTFTDGFVTRGDQFRTVKTPTTPHDLTVCFMECIKESAKAFAVPLGDFLYDTDIIRFSNTIGTNSIIQRDGPKIGLIITAGCEGCVRPRPAAASGRWWRAAWWRRSTKKPAPPAWSAGCRNGIKCWPPHSR